MENRTGKWRTLIGRTDWVLVGLVGLLGLLGMVNLASASEGMGLVSSQGIWYLLGAGLMVSICAVDYRLFERWANLLYAVVVVLLLAVLTVGTELQGARRWLNLGVFMMQPSQLLKIVTVLVTARYFQEHSKPEAFTLRELIHPFLLVGGASILVVQQPDLGTALLILAIFMSMVLFEGLKRTSVTVLVLVGLLAFPVGWEYGMEDYQKRRVLAYVGLEDAQYGASWQVRQSVIAFGSGRLWGKGYDQSTQVDQGFVPEHENDFIAANWAEEQGFAGMFLLLLLYAGLILRALQISGRAKDPFGAHVGVGVAALIFWHVLLNLAMVTGLAPVVGLTLPLLSYGGSSLLTVLFGVGLLLSISMRRRPLSSSG